MRILSFQENQYLKYKQPSFKGQRLYPIVLEKTLFSQAKEPVDAFFTKLDKSDVATLFSNRFSLNRTEYGAFILRDLVRMLNRKDWGTEFFMVEIPSKHKFKDNIKGLASIFNERNWTEVINLQSLNNFDDSIRGAGTSLLYGICKLAKEKGHTHIELDAAGEHLFDFYRNLGFKQSEVYDFKFHLSDQDFDSFLKNIERFYDKEKICK